MNNPLFDCKNGDIDPKSGPIFQFIVTILVAWIGPTPSSSQIASPAFSKIDHPGI
jgi:hypothetical protein